MTYAELKAAIQDYANNTETSFVASIPTFVKQAEQRIYRSVNLPVNRKNVAGLMTDGNKYLAVPTDFLLPLSLSLTSSSDQVFLLKGDADMMQLYQQRYQEALDLLRAQAEGRMTGDEYRDGATRMMVK